jgi:hypothetical protein
MLNKSKTGAVILSAVAVLSFTLTSAALNILLPYLLTGDLTVIVAQPERLSNPADVLALALITLIALLGLTALTAYWLYRFFGPAYYGRRGAARWALFGFLLALLIKLPDWLFSPSLWWVKYIVYTLSAFIAFFIARRLLPLKQKSD